MLIIRPYPVIRVIAPLRKQLRIIKTNLMTGHIPVTGEIIHHRSGMYRTVLLLIELIPIKYIASSPDNLRTLLLFYKGSRIRKNAAVKKTIPAVQEKHILPLYFLNRLIHSIVNAAVRLLKKTDPAVRRYFPFRSFSEKPQHRSVRASAVLYDDSKFP